MKSEAGTHHQYVYPEILTKKKLIKTLSYHLNCDNSTEYWYVNPYQEWRFLNDDYHCPNEVSDYPIRPDTKNYTYYEPSDFVNFYVENCID